MAQVETTFGTESTVAQSPNYVISGPDDRSARNPAAAPNSPVTPLDKTNDEVRNEELQTAARDAGASSGSNTGRPSRAEGQSQRHAEHRQGSASSQQASPPPTTGLGSRVAGLVTEALRTGEVPDAPDLPQPETEHRDTVVIPDSDNESEGQADHERPGAKPAKPTTERRTRRTNANAPAFKASSRPKRGANSATVLSSTEDAAGEIPSTGMPTGITKLLGGARGRKPHNGSGNDGLPKLGSQAQATSLDKGKETTEPEKASEANSRSGLLEVEVHGARPASPETGPASRKDVKGKRKAETGDTAVKRPKKGLISESTLPTIGETADESASIGTPARATMSLTTTGSTPMQASKEKSRHTEGSFHRPSSPDGSATTEENSAYGDEASYAARAERQLSGTRPTTQKKVSFVEPLNQNALHGSEMPIEAASLRPSFASGEVELPMRANLQMKAPDGGGSLNIEFVVPSNWDIKISAEATPFLSHGGPSAI